MSRNSKINAIEISPDNALSAELRGGGWVECKVRGDTFVSSFLTVLYLRRFDTKQGISATLLPDMVDAEDFRKLRVWLRWKPAAK